MNSRAIFTDGGCRNSWAGAGVHDARDSRSWILPVPGRQTNNRAEIWAIIVALMHLCEETNSHKDESVVIFSDSRWAIEMTLDNWKAKENLDLVLIARSMYQAMKQRLPQLKIEWVRGHDANLGNEKADSLATAAIERQQAQGNQDAPQIRATH